MASGAVCPKCGGSGFIIVERADVSAAEPCGCREVDRMSGLLGDAQIPPLYVSKSFDNFVVPGVENPTARGELTEVLLAVKTFVREFPNEKRPGLLLVGETGTGKTHLAVAALRQIILDQRTDGWFCNYQSLLNGIKSSYDANSNSSDRQVYQKALDCGVLLLDDLGAHRATDWVEDTINSIITHRCDNWKPLIATTNMPDPDAGSIVAQKSESGLDKWEHRRTLAEMIGARARSRLFEMCKVIKMPLVSDYRVRKGGVGKGRLF